MLKSGYKYKYNGVNQERIFNKLCLKYHFFNIKKQSKTQGEFCVNLNNHKKLDKELIEANFNIKEKKGFGFLYHILCFIRRYGIIAAISLVGLFFIIISNFVFQIQIMGIETLDKNQIVSILNENGLKGFVHKNNINCSSLEREIIESIDNVSMVSIIVKGNTLVVSIKEKVNNDEYENIDNFESIKSNYDGVITDIKLIQGTLNVKVGDVVKKGNDLVFPYIIDSSGEQRKVEAKAEIYAQIYISEKQAFYDVEMVKKRTGNVVKIINLYSFGLKIYSNMSDINLFDEYETEISKVLISENNILPIYKETITYYETQTVMIENSYEEKKSEILTNLKQKTLKNVEEYDIIINERQNIISVAGKNTVEYILEVKKRIC